MSDANNLVNSLGMLKNLESLHIERCEPTGEFPWNFNQEKFYINIEWNCLLKSVRELTNLQTLRLKNSFAEGELALSNRGKTTDDRFRMRSLEAITLSLVNGTTKVSISGQVCPILKSLSLSCMEDLIEVDLTEVTTLECLTLYECRHLRNVLGNDLLSLEIFHIKFCPTMRELPNFGRVSCLKRIFISRCWNLEDISAIETLEGLKRIWIAFCPELKSIKAIEQLKGLKRVWIQACGQLEGAICLKELKELKRIFIGKCPRLQSMEGVEYLRVLESIIIVGCPKVKSIRGVEKLEGLKEMIISDSPAINCVERLQRLPSELTTMVGRSGMPDLELGSYFKEVKICDTLSMVDAFCEIEFGRREVVEERIHSFHKTHHLLSAFIFCALISPNCVTHARSDILYGTRIVPRCHKLNGIILTRFVQPFEPAREPAWVYISVVPEERVSEHFSSMLPSHILKAFVMGVKAGEERKSLRILQSLFDQLCIHNGEYDEFNYAFQDRPLLDYDDFADDEEEDDDDDDDARIGI